MNEFRADLHCHTTCSDGSLSPEEMVRLAQKNGLSGLSITDHDTVEAYSIAIPLCAEMGISLLSGVEFSASLNEISVHILGYGFNPEDTHILNFCARHTDRRYERNNAILALLKKHGMPVTEEELAASLPPATKKRSVGRPHIAQAMVNKGYVESIQEAFRNYLSEDKPCYSPGKQFSVQDTIDIIHNAKGLSVIAHPHLIRNNKLLRTLLEMDFDGIECYYGRLPSQDHKKWLKIAQEKEWVVTGGSDFHGSIKPTLDLGCSWIDETAFNLIRQRLQMKL